MSKIETLHFYGVYPSRALGNLVLIDPLKPPLVCPLNCITCPTQYRRVDKSAFSQKHSIDPSRVVNELTSLIPKGHSLDGFLIWGSGDPLLVENILDLVLALRLYAGKLDVKNRVFIHSSLVEVHRACSSGENKTNCDKYKLIAEYVDAFLVPFIWYSEDKYTMGWPSDISLSRYVETLSMFSSLKKDLVLPEIHVFRLHGDLYPNPIQLDEIFMYLKKLRSRTIILKLIDRPSISPHLKRASWSQLEKIKEQFINEGFNVLIDTFTTPPTFKWRHVVKVLYNQVLRMPLKYTEIRDIYGELINVAIENLISNGLAKRILWDSEVFYVGTLSEV